MNDDSYNKSDFSMGYDFYRNNLSKSLVKYADVAEYFGSFVVSGMNVVIDIVGNGKISEINPHRKARITVGVSFVAMSVLVNPFGLSIADDAFGVAKQLV